MTSDDADVGRKIVVGGTWRVSAFLFASGLGVIATAIISRAVGPEQFALFTTALSLVMITTTVVDFGLYPLGLREFAALDGAPRERSFRSLITLRFAMSLLGSLAIVAFAVVNDYPAGLVWGLVAAAVGQCALSLHLSFNVPIQATYRLNTLAALEAARQTMIAALMGAAAVAFGSVGPVVGAYLPVGIVMATASALIARDIVNLRPSIDVVEMRRLIAHVGTFTVASVVGASYPYLAQVVSNGVLSARESGLFGLAFRVFAVSVSACITGVVGSFPLLVTTSRGDLDRRAYATRRLFQTVILAGALIAVTAVSGAEFIVRLLGGAEYAGAVDALRVIALALPLSFVLVTGSSVLLAAGRHRELVSISVAGALVSVGATALLSSAHGASGAAAGVVVGEAFMSAGYVTAIVRMDRRMFPNARWLAAALGGGAIASAAAFLPFASFLDGALAALAFVALAFAMRLVPPELTGGIAALRGGARSS